MVDFALLRNHHRYRPRWGNRFGANCQLMHISNRDGNWRVQQTIQGWQLWNTHHPSIRIPWGSRQYRRLIILGSIFLLVSLTSKIESRHTTRNIIVQRLRISFAYVFMERSADLLEPTPNFLWWSSTLDVINQLLPQNREHVQELLSLSSFIHLCTVCVRHCIYVWYIKGYATWHGTSTTFPESGDPRLLFTPRAVLCIVCAAESNCGRYCIWVWATRA